MSKSANNKSTQTRGDGRSRRGRTNPGQAGPIAFMLREPNYYRYPTNDEARPPRMFRPTWIDGDPRPKNTMHQYINTNGDCLLQKPFSCLAYGHRVVYFHSYFTERIPVLTTSHPLLPYGTQVSVRADCQQFATEAISILPTDCCQYSRTQLEYIIDTSNLTIHYDRPRELENELLAMSLADFAYWFSTTFYNLPPAVPLTPDSSEPQTHETA